MTDTPVETLDTDSEAEEFVGDFGFCDNVAPFNCFAFHNGKTVKIRVDPPLLPALDPRTERSA